ncbi:MAG TPA: hypothetical protein VGO04_13180 [Ensifer sp.]|jgi:hypothetical protein|uniref:hypothetical protein n=1 Tax=Ensifer sp. TaxID=1872086 RepID=UPI002E153269|nr:hypothetical protein [Ensifer sp.]
MLKAFYGQENSRMIAAPKNTRSKGRRAGRDVECQFAIREEFELLTDLAERLGWHCDEIALGLLELVEDYVSARRSGVTQDAGPDVLGATNRTRH